MESSPQALWACIEHDDGGRFRLWQGCTHCGRRCSSWPSTVVIGRGRQELETCRGPLSLSRSASLTDDLVALSLLLIGPLESALVMPPQPFLQQFPSLLARRHILDKRGHQPLLPRRESGQRGEMEQRFT